MATKIENMRITFHMAGILIALANTSGMLADNFQRNALATLASAGAVDVVAGVARLTLNGLRLMDRANAVLASCDANRWIEGVG